MRTVLVSLFFALACDCGDNALRQTQWTAEVTVDRTSGILADGVDAAVVQVRLTHSLGKSMGGWRVRVDADDARSDGAATADGDGLAVVRVRADSPGARTLTVTVMGEGSETMLDARPTVTFVRPEGGRLVFRTSPASTTAGRTLETTEIVALDFYGAPVDLAVDVAVELENEASELFGGKERATIEGVSVFDDLRIEKAREGYRLRAVSPGLSSATSDPFDILPGLPDPVRSRLRVFDSPALADGREEVRLEATLSDAFGNPTPGHAVTFALHPDDASDAFSASFPSTAEGLGSARVRTLRPGTRTAGASVAGVELDDRPEVVFDSPHRVSGIADGVRGPGLRVRLEADDRTEFLDIAASGAFFFTEPFATGIRWRVTLESEPDAQACLVVGGDGRTTGDDGALRVRCGLRWRATANGDGTAIGLTTDGRLWTWGFNGTGQLGDGTTETRTAPVEPLPGETFKAIAAGAAHFVAVRASDGSVWTVGRNEMGQLGDGTTDDRHRFEPVGGEELVDVVRVAASLKHSLALRADGALWSWGGNKNGTVGDGTNTNRLEPVRVGADDDMRFVDIAAGASHALALRDDGTVWGWGHGFLPTPERLDAATDHVAVGAGAHTSFAIRRDGSLWAMGSNTFGQLGDGTTTHRDAFVRVGEEGVAFTSVAGGNWHTLAVSDDGTLWSWGGPSKQTGFGNDGVARLTPHRLGTGYAHVSASEFQSSAIRTDTTLHVWGSSTHRGDGTSTYGNPPKPLATNIRSVSTSVASSLAVTLDGRLLGTGHNVFEPPGTLVQRDAWRATGERVDSASAGLHSFARRTDGVLVGWGQNDVGQLGLPSTAASLAPTILPLENTIGAPFARIFPSGGTSATVARSFAITADGALHAWGHSTPPPGVERWTPVHVGDGFASLAPHMHIVGLKTDGTVETWGDNAWGELGDENGPRATPAPVELEGRFVEVGSGDGFSIALRDDGTLWGWGRGGGMVEGREMQSQPVPAQIPTPVPVVAMSVGDYHVLALDENGRPWGWGSNGCGQIDPARRMSWHPLTELPLPPGKFRSVVAGPQHSFALTDEGVLWGWGCNLQGQLGTEHDDAFPAFVPCVD